MSVVQPAPLFYLPWSSHNFMDPSGEFDRFGDCSHSQRFVGDQPNISLQYLCRPENLLRSDWPLVLWGPHGTGKTSIGLSIASSLAKRTSRPPALFTANSFRRRFCGSIETDSLSQFRDFILSASAVFIDDIQFLRGHESTQLELASLLDDPRILKIPRIVSLSESFPGWDGLIPGLASRLSLGLCLRVDQPGPDARRVLIAEAGVSFGFHLSTDALEHLIDSLAINYPKMRSFFGQLAIWMKAQGLGHLDFVDSPLLSRFIESRSCSAAQTIAVVNREVCRSFHVKLADLKSSSRKQSFVQARGVAVYLLRTMVNLSFARIGQIFGGRDHSTIVHSFHRIESQLLNRVPDITQPVLAIQRKVQENSIFYVESSSQ